MSLCTIIKVAVMSINENYLVVDRVGAVYVGELGHGFKPPKYIHIPRWCLMEFPVQWDLEVDILGLLLGLVKNYGWHEALPIGSGKEK